MNSPETIVVKSAKLFYRIIINYYFAALFSFFTLIICFFIENTLKIEEFSYSLILVFLMSGVFLFYLFKRIFQKNRIRITAVVILVFLLIIVGLLIYFFSIIDLKKIYVDDTLGLANQIFNNQTTYFKQYLPFLVFIPLIIFMFLYLSYYSNYLFVTGFFVCILLFLQAAQFGYSFRPYSVYMLIIIVAYTMFGMHYRYNIKENQNYKLRQQFINYSVILTLVIVITSKLISLVFGYANQNNRIYDLYQNTSKAIINYLNLSEAEYSEDDTVLGGNIYESDSLALLVEAKQEYYLRGNIKTYYDGKSWKKISSKEKNYKIAEARAIDALTNYYRRINNIKDTNEYETITIIPKDVRATTYFVPPHAASVGRVNFAMRDLDYIYHAIYLKNIKDRYTVKIKKNNISSEIHFKTHIMEDIKPYLQLPGTISLRTYQLAEKLLGPKPGIKLKIETLINYLMSAYTYSFESEFPSGKTDFLDHFLFSEKKGYCEHFATAATILLRIANIPTRYVEGFKMLDEKDEEGRYFVTNKMAHAWCEALIDKKKNIWMIVEATPGLPTVAAERPYWMDRYGERSDRRGAGVRGRSNNRAGSSAEKSDESMFLFKFNLDFINLPEIKVNIFLFLLVPVLMLAVIFFLKYWIQTIYITQRKSSIPIYKYLRKRLIRFNYFLSKTDTLQESLAAIENRKLADLLQKIIFYYESEIYGNEILGYSKYKLLRNIKKELLTNNRFPALLAFYLF